MLVGMQKVSELIGTIPFDNISDAEVVVENFCSNDIAVVTTNRVTNITHGSHFHNSYEFDICYTKIPSTVIDNKIYDRKNSALFAVNPMQEHGMKSDFKGFNLCAVHLDESLMQNASMNIYGSRNITFSNDSFIVSHDISMLIRLLLEELRYKQSGYEYMVENLSLLIGGSMIRQIKHNLSSGPYKALKSNKEDIKTVIDYMNENYTAGVSCTELASLIKMDKFGFIRSFKSQTNKTPYEYLLDLKIEKAKKMLKANDYSITEISMQCGFSSHSHFTSTFKKKTGISPTEYRKTP